MLADADGRFLGLLESQGIHVFFRYAHGYVMRWTGKQRPLGTKRPHATFIIKSIPLSHLGLSGHSGVLLPLGALSGQPLAR